MVAEAKILHAIQEEILMMKRRAEKLERQKFDSHWRTNYVSSSNIWLVNEATEEKTPCQSQVDMGEEERQDWHSAAEKFSNELWLY